MGLYCQILLAAPPEGVYKSGQHVKGVLNYKLNKQTSFQSIVVKFEGKAKCKWSTSSDDSTTYHFGNEKYISMTKNITQITGYHLAAGIHSNAFEFYVPENIPSSFKDKTCTITYKIIAKFSKSGIFNKDKEFDKEITVYGHLQPCSSQPLIFGLTKDPFSITSTGKVYLKIEIERTFLMPGENINLKCSIKNDSDLTVFGVKSKLISEITYKSNKGTQQVQRKAIDESTVKSPGVKENSIISYNYKVPTLPHLYSIQHSNVLIRQYKLSVTIKLPFPHRNASVEIPVVIGEGYNKVNWQNMDRVRHKTYYYDDGGNYIEY